MRNFKIKIPIVFALLLSCILPFANVTKLVGIEDGLSKVIILFLVLIYLTSELQRSGLKFHLSIELYILLLCLVFGVMATIVDKVDLTLLIGHFVKVIVLVSVYTVVNRHAAILSYFLKYYYHVFFFSLFISLPLWTFYPVPEFVFYDGSERRFGGLHFELFNYCFSLCIALVSWMYNGRNKLLGILIFVILGLLSGSNMFPIFALVFLIPKTILSFFKYKFVACTTFLGICLLPVLIGLFLDELEFLAYLGLRDQAQFNVNGSSIYVRLFPFKLAVDYMIATGPAILFPSGMGVFESSRLVADTQHSYGGTGSPKALIDLGVVLFFLLIVALGLKASYGFRAWGPMKYTILRLNLACILFISFGAGFFNLVAWSILFMSAAWKGDQNE